MKLKKSHLWLDLLEYPERLLLVLPKQKNDLEIYTDDKLPITSNTVNLATLLLICWIFFFFNILRTAVSEVAIVWNSSTNQRRQMCVGQRSAAMSNSITQNLNPVYSSVLQPWGRDPIWGHLKGLIPFFFLIFTPIFSDLPTAPWWATTLTTTVLDQKKNF